MHHKSWWKARHLNVPTQCTAKSNAPMQGTPKTQHIYSVQHVEPIKTGYKGDFQNVKKKIN